METMVSVLALVVSVLKIILMWLNYRSCKKSRKNTDWEISQGLESCTSLNLVCTLCIILQK